MYYDRMFKSVIFIITYVYIELQIARMRIWSH
jgi:hypothetical protein